MQITVLQLGRVRAGHSLSSQEAWSFDNAKDLANRKMKALSRAQKSSGDAFGILSQECKAGASLQGPNEGLGKA